MGMIIMGDNSSNTDIPSLAREELTNLRRTILTAAGRATDHLTKYHLLDLAERIKRALEGKK
jgi:hypothetical protein